jgi:hypothetical protein
LLLIVSPFIFIFSSFNKHFSSMKWIMINVIQNSTTSIFIIIKKFEFQNVF